MTTESQLDYETLVPVLREDLSLSNRQNGSGLSHMIEVSTRSMFFNIGADEYRYLCYLDGRTSLKQAWHYYRKEIENQNPTSASQGLNWEQAIQVFKFLHSQKLIAEINEKPISMDQDTVQTQRIQNVNPYGFRLKLFDADAITNRWSSRLGPLFGALAFVVWTFAILWACMLIIGNSTNILSDTKLVLPGALV